MVKFLEPPESNQQPDKAPKKPMPTWAVILITLIIAPVVLFVSCAGCIAGGMALKENTENQSALTSQPDETSTSSEAPEKPLIKVKASQIYKDFDANEARAIKKYADKRIQITGIVDRIDSTFNDEPIVYLKTPNQFSSVHIDLVESDWSKAEGYNKGQQKTFVCESADEMIGSPMLKDCIDYGS
jgi:hypothetical protein